VVRISGTSSEGAPRLPLKHVETLSEILESTTQEFLNTQVEFEFVLDFAQKLGAIAGEK
jgi:hypothetical protein